MSDYFMNTRELSQYIGRSVGGIRNMISKCTLPFPYYKDGATTLFRKSEVDAYMETIKINPVHHG